VQTGTAGVGFLQFCNLNSFRTKFILGFSLFMGLSVPQYFNEYTSVAGFGPVHTRARWVRDPVQFLYDKSSISETSCFLVFFDNALKKSCKLTDNVFSSCSHVQFNDMVNVVFSSKAFVGGAVAYFLDNTLQRRDGAVRKDRGHHFWDRFRSFKTDPRSEEFYSLPFNLNKFFPSF
jgi:hypothetical protein